MGAGTIKGSGGANRRGRDRRRRGQHRSMSEINITPFVDVMLVLLIIFMVAAPLLTVGVPVQLPETAAEALPVEQEEPLTVTLTAEGGIMIQQMPDSDGVMPDAPSGEDGLMSADDVAGMGSRAEDWNRVTTLLDTADAHEMIGPLVTPETVLHRLFHEETPSVYAAQPVEFGCTCSAEKVERAMFQYSAKDLEHMTTEDGKLTADCQFCSAHYEFDPKTLGFEAERRSENPESREV